MELRGPWLWCEAGVWRVYWRAPSLATGSLIFKSVQCLNHAAALQTARGMASTLAQTGEG